MTAESVFDGWGYMHLYRNDPGGLVAVDHFAIPEALDERFGGGDFGDLSVHEFATDATENLAYSSYYAGGMRVLSFGDTGMEQVGAFIDEGGNNFWGVEQFTTPQGDRLIAGSDRDYGLYLFRYTGPGAAQKPACSDTTALVPFHGSGDVPLTCSDANANPLTESIVSGPTSGTLSGDANSGKVTYTHTGRRLGTGRIVHLQGERRCGGLERRDGEPRCRGRATRDAVRTRSEARGAGTSSWAAASATGSARWAVTTRSRAGVAATA